jgi:hypothetical protein
MKNNSTFEKMREDEMYKIKLKWQPVDLQIYFLLKSYSIVKTVTSFRITTEAWSFLFYK